MPECWLLATLAIAVAKIQPMIAIAPMLSFMLVVFVVFMIFSLSSLGWFVRCSDFIEQQSNPQSVCDETLKTWREREIKRLFWLIARVFSR